MIPAGGCISAAGEPSWGGPALGSDVTLQFWEVGKGQLGQCWAFDLTVDMISVRQFA